MKKILVTLMTVIALTAFTACESKGIETAEETTMASVSEETTTEKKTEAETEAVEDTIIFKGTGYTLEIDNNKWIDSTNRLDRIAEYAEDSGIAENLDVTAEDMQNMGDAVFNHSTDKSNFNVTVAELGVAMDDATLVQLASLIQEQYNSMTGYSCGEYELVNVNGYRALKFVITTDTSLGGTELKLNAYMFYPGTKQVAVTFTTAASDFDETVVDFEEVLNTISFE